MGQVTKTFNENQQIEITISQPGRYTIDLRQLPKKRKMLLILRTNQRPQVDIKNRNEP